MPPDDLIGVVLLNVADIGQLADETERVFIAEREMVDPIDQPRAGVFAQLMGQLVDDRIARGKRVDRSRHPAGSGRLSFPNELILSVGDGSLWYPASVVPCAADGAEITPLFNYTANTGISR